jgi:hypothetical protein
LSGSKGSTFLLEVEANNAFQSLKASFMTTPLLIHTNLSKSFVLETNASNFALGVVFSQPKDNDLLHPIDFHSCKKILVEINYDIHDKKTFGHCQIF